jgi:hypothetical protein
MEVKKQPKIRMGATRRNLILRSKMKITPVRPIPSVIRKEKSLTRKHLSKIGWTKLSYGQPWNHGRRRRQRRRQTAERRKCFFVKTGFSSIKSPNSSRKSIKKNLKSLNQYFILTSFRGSKKMTQCRADLVSF